MSPKDPKLKIHKRPAVFAFALGLSLMAVLAFFAAPQTARAADCAITEVSWSKNTAALGEVVALNARGTDCAGKNVKFDIIERTALIGSRMANGTLFATFDSSGAAQANWTVGFADNSATDRRADYFRASASDSSKESDWLTVTCAGGSADTGGSNCSDSTVNGRGLPGNVILNVSGTPQRLSNAIVVVFEAQYSGPASPALATFNFDCGNGASGTRGVSNPMQFFCSYSGTSGTSDVNVGATALSAAGSKLGGQTIKLTLDFDNNSVNQAAGDKSKEVDDPFRTYVTSMLSPIFAAIQSFLFLLYFAMVMPLMVAIGSIQTGVGACNAGSGTGFLSNICGAWQIVRNFVNMVFILIMIIIGVATILRLQSYNYKRLLGKLIIMALLVNFSLVIAQAFLKLFDILRFTFFDPSSIWQLTKLGYKLIGYHLVSVGGTDPIQAIGTALALSPLTPFGQIPVIAAELMNLSLSLLAFVTMAALAVYMLIATVALRILLILSPFWPALLVVPATASLARAWWMNFFKYGLFLPIIFFFMRIAVELMDKPFFGQISNGCDALKAANAAATCPASMGLFSSLVFNGLQQVEVVAFLFAGLAVAKKLSIFGSGALTSLGQKAAMLPLVVGGAAIGAGAGAGLRAYSSKMGKLASAAEQAKDWKKADRYKMLSMLNPIAAKKAWEERKKEKEIEAYGESAGHARDFLNRYMPTEWNLKEGKLGRRSKFGRIGEKAVLNYKRGEWQDAQLSEEEKVEAYLAADNPSDKMAIRQLLIEGRHEDGLRIIQAIERQGEREAQLMKQFMSQGQSEPEARRLAKNQVTTEVAEGKLPRAIFDAVDDDIEEFEELGRMGMTEAARGNFSSAQSEQGEAEQKVRALGKEYYNEHNGAFYSTTSRQLWNDLETQIGTGGMLEKLHSLGMKNLEMTDSRKELRKVINERTGQLEEKEVEVPLKLVWKYKDKNGAKQTKDITNAHTLQEAIDLTSKTAGVSNVSGGNLRYQMTGKLKEQSARKRMMRGNTERWGAAFEPAGWMIQDEHGNFIDFTSYGEEQIRNLSAAHVNSFSNSRQMQARVMKAGGFYVDEKTGETELERPNIFLKLYDLNRDLAIGLAQKGDFAPEPAEKFAQELTDYCKTITDPSFMQFKDKSFGLGPKSSRGGFAIEMGDPSALRVKNIGKPKTT